MTQIDWSKAPEGYPLWIVPTGGPCRPDWHKEEDGDYIDVNGRFWLKANEGKNFIVYRKPEEPSSPAWDGTGKPPAGTVCEAWFDDGKVCWHEAEVICNHPTEPGVIAVRLKSERQHNRLAWVDNIRPIRTPEQIAAERELTELRSIIESTQANGGDIAESILAYGYRKQVAP